MEHIKALLDELNIAPIIMKMKKEMEKVEFDNLIANNTGYTIKTLDYDGIPEETYKLSVEKGKEMEKIQSLFFQNRSSEFDYESEEYEKISTDYHNSIKPYENSWTCDVMLEKNIDWEKIIMSLGEKFRDIPIEWIEPYAHTYYKQRNETKKQAIYHNLRVNEILQ